MNVMKCLIISGVAGATLMLSNTSADGAKGGGQHLLARPTVEVAVVQKAAAPAQPSCAKCTSKEVKTVRSESKGHVKIIQTALVHECSACKATKVVLGHGKTKVEKTVSSCSAADASQGCCKK